MKIKKSLSLLLLITIALVYFTSCKTSKKQVDKTSKNKQNIVVSDEDKIKNSALFTEACKQKILGYNAEAMILFKECLKNNPENHAAMFELAGLFSAKMQFDSAIYWSNKAVYLDDKNFWYLQLHGELLLNTKQFDEALDTYEKIANLNPADKEPYKDWATAASYAKKYKKSIQIYNLIEERFGISYDIFIEKAKIYILLKNIDEAIYETERIIEKYPQEIPFYQYLSELYLMNKQPDKAFNVYQQILKIDSLNTDINFLLSDYYRAIGEKEKSYLELKKAFENPFVDFEEKAKILFSYYDLTPKYPELKKQANELSYILTKKHSANYLSYTIYGDFLYQDDQKKEAREQYKKAFGLDSSNFMLVQQIMFCSSALVDNQSLLEESNKAISLFPEQAIAYLFNGFACIGLNKYEDAIKVLNLGLPYLTDDKDPMTEQYYATLGDAYYKTNDFKKSFETYDKALILNPKNAYVLNNYSYYLSLRNEELAKALTMAKKAVQIDPNNVSYLDTYAWALYKNKDFAMAKIVIEQAIANGAKSSAVIIEHYGDILYKLNEKDKAVDMWEKAKSIGKGSDLLDKKINDKTLYE